MKSFVPAAAPRSAASKCEQPSGRGGFTLIELLVVISIILILVGLAASTFGRAKAAAKLAACKGNVRQLELALKMYLDDNTSYPLFSHLESSGLKFWPDALAPLLSELVYGTHVAGGAVTSFQCPAVRSAKADQAVKAITYGFTDQGFAYQGLGEKLVAAPGGWMPMPVRESDVVNPSETIALADGISRLTSGVLIHSGITLKRWQLDSPRFVVDDPLSSLGPLLRSDRIVRSFHSGRANVGFCDGHVEANSLKRLFEDTTDSALSRWNRDHAPHREWLLP
jgi:prepilin-type processing-associated H-X9-DG protein/prepilin-type N-terminal cleavage/methylation domain-containing protein